MPGSWKWQFMPVQEQGGNVARRCRYLLGWSLVSGTFWGGAYVSSPLLRFTAGHLRVRTHGHNKRVRTSTGRAMEMQARG
jgi:hypothetical protein